MTATLALEPKNELFRRTGKFRIETNPYHSRLAHIVIDEQALDAFFAATRHIDVQNLEYVPFMQFMLAKTLVKYAGEDLGAVLKSTVVDRRFGGFTLGTEGRASDPGSYVRFATAISHLLGPANHDAMSGNYYARFTVEDRDTSDSYLRQAYRLFTLHTDGTFVDEATDWLLMMKFAEENAVGGESRLLHLDDWHEAEKFAHHALGKANYIYKAPGSKNVAHTIERPLFFNSPFGRAVSFIDQFVQPRTLEEASFLHDFSQSAEECPGTVDLPLPVGDLVVVNNYFWLHGRAPFKRDPGLHRELMRLRGAFIS